MSKKKALSARETLVENNDLLKLRYDYLKKHHGMTQERLSKLSGYSQSAISAYLSGKSTLTYKAALRLAPCLQCKPVDIYPALSDINLDPEKQELLQLIESLNRDDQEYLYKWLELAAKRKDID